jgi:hypothetical protein
LLPLFPLLPGVFFCRWSSAVKFLLGVFLVDKFSCPSVLNLLLKFFLYLIINLGILLAGVRKVFAFIVIFFGVFLIAHPAKERSKLIVGKLPNL